VDLQQESAIAERRDFEAAYFHMLIPLAKT
jgi:hypothetical protein